MFCLMRRKEAKVFQYATVGRKIDHSILAHLWFMKVQSRYMHMNEWLSDSPKFVTFLKPSRNELHHQIHTPNVANKQRTKCFLRKKNFHSWPSLCHEPCTQLNYRFLLHCCSCRCLHSTSISPWQSIFKREEEEDVAERFIGLRGDENSGSESARGRGSRKWCPRATAALCEDREEEIASHFGCFAPILCPLCTRGFNKIDGRCLSPCKTSQLHVLERSKGINVTSFVSIWVLTPMVRPELHKSGE